jgi:inorganic pyrophosphatase
MNNEIEVYIQNLPGSHIKNRHNEATLEHLGKIELVEPYPFAYGFIPGTIAADGDCLDCYLLSDADLMADSLIRCIPIGVLEQFPEQFWISPQLCN